MKDIRLTDATLKALKSAKEFCLAAEAKVYKRCLLEGCRYGIEGVDKEPTDECIYCGELRRHNYIITDLMKLIKKFLDD